MVSCFPASGHFLPLSALLAAEQGTQAVTGRAALQANGLGWLRSSLVVKSQTGLLHPPCTQKTQVFAGAYKIGVSVSTGVSFSVLLINNRKLNQDIP